MVLGPVIGLASRGCEKSSTSRLDDGRLTFRSGAVENLGKQVTIVVDAEIEVAPCDEIAQIADDLVSDGADHARLGASSDASGVSVGEISTKGSSIIA